MDSTTQMQVEQILNQGWYRKSQTLGEGGWAEIYSNGGMKWKIYCLYEMLEGEIIPLHDVETIFAKDDKTALEAFQSLYHMDKFYYWEIQEKIVEYRLIATKEVGEIK